MFEIKNAIKNVLSTSENRLTRKNNPFYKKENLKKLTATELMSWIIDYSIFSRNAIHFLLQARIKLDQWKATAKELDRNMAEELNEDGVPHLDIMNTGYYNELKLPFTYRPHNGEQLLNIATIQAMCNGYYPHRNGLVSNLNIVFNKTGDLYTAGAVLALEYIAYEEFHILKAMITEYKRKCKIKQTPFTDLYINIHLGVEINHYQKLLGAILKDVISLKRRKTYTNFTVIENQMYQGFYDVCGHLNNWWLEWEDILLKKVK